MIATFTTSQFLKNKIKLHNCDMMILNNKTLFGPGKLILKLMVDCNGNFTLLKMCFFLLKERGSKLLWYWLNGFMGMSKKGYLGNCHQEIKEIKNFLSSISKF
jgi:hypothetical protein